MENTFCSCGRNAISSSDVEVDGAQGVYRLLGIFPPSECVWVGWVTVDMRGGCLEGVNLRHFKPLLLSFYRPYQVS